MGDSENARSETKEKETEAAKSEEDSKATVAEEKKADLSGDSAGDGSADAAAKSEEAIPEEKAVEESKTETILSSQSLNSSNPSISMTNELPTVPATSPKEKHLNRNQSDILPSLREVPRDEDPSLMIFSSKGLPTKKYFRRREVNSTILPFGFNEPETPKTTSTPRVKAEVELTPKITIPRNIKLEEAKKTPFGDKNPNVPNPSVSRNVLTGLGVNSKDEFRSKSAKRKDGNPVLGVGYEEPVASSKIGRVPPGGYSSGLW